jgi:hypothetical protein
VLEATEVPVPQAIQSDELKARFAENHLEGGEGQGVELKRVGRLGI